MNCPACDGELEQYSGSFGTGVFAPDGTQETYWEEGLKCLECGTTFDKDDPDLENKSSVPCSRCGRPTTFDPTYGDLCYEHIRADNE